MEPTHSLLQRQLKRHFGENYRVPAEWAEFVNAVSAAYREFDVDRTMLERSLELSSQELLNASSEMRAVLQAIPDLLFRLDRDGTILDFKAGNTSDLLLQRRQLFGKRIQDIPNQPISDQFHEAIRRVHEEKSVVRFEYSLALRGRESCYEARLVPLPESQIVAIIQNITERKRLEMVHAHHANLRADVNQALALGGATLPKILQVCSEAVVRHLDAAFARIWTLNAKENTLELQASAGLYTHLNGPHARVPVGAFKIGLIAQERKPHLTNDVPRDPRVSDREWAAREGMVAFAGYPLIVEDRLVGVLGIFARHELPEDTLEVLGSIACTIAQGIERRRAEEELRRKQSQLIEALRIGRLAYWEYDVPADTFTFNDQFYSILRTTAAAQGGYTLSSGQYTRRFVHPDDIAVVGAEIQKALAATEPNYSRELDHRIMYADGEIGFVAVHIRIEKDAGGRTIKTHGAYVDITGRKRAEDELRHTVSLLQSTFNSTADGILVVDRTGRIISFNQRFVLLWQIPQAILDARDDDAAIGHVLNQLKDPEAFVQKVRELYANPDVESFDVLEFKDGRVFERYSCPQRLDGAPVGRVWSFRDVTERKRSEETLLKLSRAVEQTADSVLITNARGVIEYVNPSFEAMTGYTRDEVVGKTPRILKSGRHTSEFHAELWKTILGGRVYNGVLVNRKKNGEFFDAELTITPIKDARGQITHFVSTDKDVTERKELEAQLRQAQKMEAFGQLAAGVAHDFNNILTIIQGNLALLRMGLGPKETTSAVEQSLAAAGRAANLTRQLLTFSRRQPLQPHDLDLNEVVANMTKMLQRLIGEHIALEARYAPGGAPIHADPGMMEQVLMNLAVNSRDAMPKGGRLILQTAAKTVSEADVRLHPNSQARAGEFIELSVSDTGSGITPENLPHIFEPFFTTKETGKGTGLGLATVFGIVEQHQGWIEVDSKKGSGTTFRLFLPRLSRAAAEKLDALPALPEVRGGAETILLVEDDSAVRELMLVLLTGHGYQVHEAVSGIAAFHVWAEHRDRIELLVTDMVMPGGVGGRELAEHLSSDKPGLKVIYCSGYTDDALGQDSPLRNNDNFLEKPFEPLKFLQRVRTCLDQVK